MQMTVCFHDGNNGHDCGNSAQVGVVRCEGFLLWRLPNPPPWAGSAQNGYCDSAYCTASSGL